MLRRLLLSLSSVLLCAAGCRTGYDRGSIVPSGGHGFAAATPQTQAGEPPTCKIDIVKPYWPYPGSPKYHVGTDFGPCVNMDIISIGDGIVMDTDSTSDPKNPTRAGLIVINHAVPDGNWGVIGFLYAHVKNIAVTTGEHVHRGQVLGQMW